jgi:hypothetical protein
MVSDSGCAISECVLHPESAPEVAEICSRLTEAEKRAKGHLSGAVSLIAQGLNIQQDQFVSIYSTNLSISISL